MLKRDLEVMHASFSDQQERSLKQIRQEVELLTERIVMDNHANEEDGEEQRLLNEAEEIGIDLKCTYVKI